MADPGVADPGAEGVAAAAGAGEPAGATPLLVSSVTAWRGRFADGSAEGLDAVVVEFDAEGGTVPPLAVPVDALSHLARALFEAGRTETEAVAPAATASVIGGPAWAALLAGPRRPARDLGDIPPAPGVYAWLRDGVPVYLGRAKAKRGLRSRIGYDRLETEADLGRTGFRRAVAEHLGLPVDRRLDDAGLAAVNGWIAGCEVVWQAHPSSDSAMAAEAALRAEHDHQATTATPGPPPSV